MYSSRYVFDTLYGVRRLPDYVWEILTCPELQRLREVRMCNVNSLCLPGGANVNRYEHSLGTAILALECTQQWSTILDRDARSIVLAALLHDVAGAAFGHSVQYVLQPSGYRHEALDLAFGEQGNGCRCSEADTDPVYFGMMRRLGQHLSGREFSVICDIVAGGHPFRSLINGTLDLDNIDNVFRLAYHIGLTKRSHTPMVLARALRIDDSELVIDDLAVDCVREWYEVRKRLYTYLLLNADEFSAKCMLEEALIRARASSECSVIWTDVDYQLLDKLLRCSDDISHIIQRLVTGDLYGCIGIFAAAAVELYDIVADPRSRQGLERSLQQLIRERAPGFETSSVALHAIKDTNKTQRVVELRTSRGKLVRIGNRLDRVLLGIFDRDPERSVMGMSETLIRESGVRSLIQSWLKQELGFETGEIDPYAEADE